MIEFSTGSISPTTDLAGFLVSQVGRASRITLTNKQWQHFEIEPEPDIAATVVFHSATLARILIAIKMPSDVGGSWSERVEHERKARHDSWLRIHLGEPPYNYPWGRIGSEYDAKGCASEIIVAYDR